MKMKSLDFSGVGGGGDGDGVDDVFIVVLLLLHFKLTLIVFNAKYHFRND